MSNFFFFPCMTRLPASVSTFPNLPGLSQMLVSGLLSLILNLAIFPPALSLAFPVSGFDPMQAPRTVGFSHFRRHYYCYPPQHQSTACNC